MNLTDMNTYAIGADIGGSHISCAAIDLKHERIVRESFSSASVNNHAPSDEIIAAWAQALRSTIQKMGNNALAGIGFAMPGPFDYERGIALFKGSNEKFENLNGVNVAQAIQSSLNLSEDIPIRFMNDATSFAIGEVWMGKATGNKRSVSITLGTGFGSAFVDGETPVVERTDVPEMGCVWHLAFKDGIADDYFSTRWFINSYKKQTGILAAGVKEIAELAKNEALAMDLFVEFGNNLGLFMGPWLKRFDAETLVIGGNIAGAYPLFGTYFKQSLQTQGVNTGVYISELKEDAALIGSAKLVSPDFWQKVKSLLSKM